MAKKSTVKKQNSKAASKAQKSNGNLLLAIWNGLSMPLKIVVSVVALTLLFLGYVAFQPDMFLVERQITIEAPVAKIFPHVNDIKAWEFWSPWMKMDPSMKLTYSGPAEGLGATCHWAGNDQVGEGTFTITDSQKDNQVVVEVDMEKPHKSKNTMTFFFIRNDQNANETGIKWRATGKSTFAEKFMHIFVDLDSTMGVTFQRGLEYIKVATQPGYKTNQ